MDSLLECLTDWMRRQRWYAGKGRLPELRVIGSWQLDADEPDVVVRTLLVMDDGGAAPTLYQVPITERRTIPRGWGQVFIGRTGPDTFVFDAPHDPAYTRALLRLVEGQTAPTPDRADAAGTRSASGPTVSQLLPVSRVLSGEQSNTSIVFEFPDSPETAPVICKIFRTLHHGENPDVVLQTAISRAGSSRVPASVGHVTGSWDDVGRDEGRATGHLAFAQEFMPGVEDAWKVALASAAAGDDFTEQAAELGRATAEVHRILATELPTRGATIGDVVAVAAVWRRRLAVAISEVPELARFREPIEAVYDRAADGAWPALQRVHGDYHLGQVLRVPERGFVLVDFEGEPLRPMHERGKLDEPLRDVAGMLRSFDYVAGASRLAPEPVDAERWAADARRAFTSAWLEASGADLDRSAALLDAFEIDKAVYEAVYEARNRPDWLPIPVGALERLVSASVR